MNKSDASQSASELISKRIAELGDWRGKTLGRMRPPRAPSSTCIGGCHPHPDRVTIRVH
jgi:hypothetical protein